MDIEKKLKYLIQFKSFILDSNRFVSLWLCVYILTTMSKQTNYGSFLFTIKLFLFCYFYIIFFLLYVY